MGLAGALGGALKGGLIGAGVGAAGLGAAGALGRRPGFAAGLTQRAGATGAAARFGQRQLHGFTGWEPVGGIRAIRGGAYPAEQQLAKLTAPGAKPVQPGWLQRLRGVTPEEATRKAKDVAGRRAAAARAAEEAKLTSLPGYAKGLATKPIETLRTGTREAWHSMGPFGRGLIYGVPAAGIAKEMATPSEPGGPGRLERTGKHLEWAAYGLGPLPITAQFALAPAIGALATRGGRAAGRLRKKGGELAPPSVDPAGGETQAEEYITGRAAGMGAT
jgi:hypothetical protein